MADTFVCAMCGGTFEKDWSDDEAEVELKEKNGDFAAALAVLQSDFPA